MLLKYVSNDIHRNDNSFDANNLLLCHVPIVEKSAYTSDLEVKKL